MYARGGIVGITRGTNRNHIIRASLESIGYQCRDVIEAMIDDVGHELKAIKVDGGASKNNFLMQFQTDIIGTEVVRPEVVETTALGAAYLAGLSVAFWKDKHEILEAWRIDTIFNCKIDRGNRDKSYRGWKKAVKWCMDWESEDSEE